MSIWQWIFWYLVSWIAMFLLACVTRKGGYGEMFDSAAQALVFNLFWPVLMFFMLMTKFLDWLGPTWEKVEAWWDGPARKSRYDD